MSSLLHLLRANQQDAWNLRQVSKKLRDSLSATVTGITSETRVGYEDMIELPDFAAKFPNIQRVTLMIENSSRAGQYFKPECFTKPLKELHLKAMMVELQELETLLSRWADSLCSLELSQCYMPVVPTTCTALKTLHLTAVRMEDLSALSSCPGLETLNVEWSDIDRLGNVVLPRLDKLSLRSCGDLMNLEGIEGCENLQRLSVKTCNDLSSLESLTALTALSSIKLRSCFSIESLETLTALRALSSINLRKGISSLIEIKGCIAVKKLVLEDLCDLVNLEECCPVEDLYLANCMNFRSLHGIEVSTSLKTVELVNTDLETLEGLERCPGLSTLNLIRCYSLEHMSPLYALTCASIIQCSSLQNLVGLSGITSLIRLDIMVCHSISSLVGLEGCTSLTRLVLVDCPSLSNVVGLDRIAPMKQLYIEKCPLLWHQPDWNIGARPRSPYYKAATASHR